MVPPPSQFENCCFASTCSPLYKILCLSQQSLRQRLQRHGLFDHILVPHKDAVPDVYELKRHNPHGRCCHSEKEKQHQEPQANFEEAGNTDEHLKMNTDTMKMIRPPLVFLLWNTDTLILMMESVIYSMINPLHDNIN